LALVVAVSFQIRDYRTRERAWVLVTIDHHAPIDFGADAYRFAGRMENYGATPARIIRRDHFHAYVQRGEHLPKKPKYLTEMGGEQFGFHISPKGGEPLYWTGSKTGMEDIKKGERILYFYGRVQYRDIFGRKRETRYCYRYYPTIEDSIDTHFGFFPEGPPEYTRMT
jgi:hypothetical protein